MSLCVLGASLDGVPVGLRIDRGRITELAADIAERSGDDVLDGSGCALVPGLVNGHTHAGMTLFRGYGSDLPLMTWLEDWIWPKEALLTADDVYWGTRLACVEMIRSGTVKFWDMYWHPGAVARAVEDAGLRATVGLPLIDGFDPERSKALRADALESLDMLSDTGPRVTPALAPHGIYTVSEESMRWIGEYAAEHGLAIQTHFLELEEEASGLLARTGEQPAAYLDRLGVLTPDTVLAHGVWMEEADLELVAARGATVVTNPASNMKLAVGRAFPYDAVRSLGIPVGLGTDGASSNNGLDLLADMKLLSLLEKHTRRDPAALPAAEAWAIATGARAPRLGPSAQLAVDEPADFLLVRLDVPELTPGDLVANLVYAASGAVVHSTVVDGKVLMRDRRVADEAEVRAKAAEAARRLGIVT